MTCNNWTLFTSSLYLWPFSLQLTKHHALSQGTGPSIRNARSYSQLWQWQALCLQKVTSPLGSVSSPVSSGPRDQRFSLVRISDLNLQAYTHTHTHACTLPQTTQSGSMRGLSKPHTLLQPRLKKGNVRSRFFTCLQLQYGIIRGLIRDLWPIAKPSESLCLKCSPSLPRLGFQYLEVTGTEIMQTNVTEHSTPFSIFEMKKSTRWLKRFL